jgi:hypothetical protein
MQLTVWQLGKVARLLIGLTKIFLTKSGFDQNLLDKIGDHPSEIESLLRLRTLLTKDHDTKIFRKASKCLIKSLGSK